MQSRHKPIILILILSYINVLNGQQQTSIYLPDKFIQEEIPIGSLIADVSEELEIEANRVAAKSATPSVSSSTNSGENQHYTFLEDSKSSTENTYFLLDPITGRLTSKRYLDREAMCLNRHCARPCSESPGGSCSMRLRMLIIPSYQIVSLNVVVQDINDNKPQFRVDLVNLTVPENVPIGYRIPLDLAYDPDMGKNSIQSYSLTQQSNGNNNKKTVPTTETTTSYFELIQPTTGENVQQQLQLVVKRALDRETVAQHNLSIMACDGGEPSNCGQLRLVVNIGDINDNSPIFRRELYEFSVFENAPKGTVVGRIEANDLDAGINQKIKYKLMSSSTGGVGYFELDELNGLLTLAQPIDFEIDMHFTLKAEARDFGVGSLPAYTQIEVRVLDLNDNPPEISVSFLNSLQRNASSSSSSSSSSTKSTNDLLIYLPENTESSSFIAHVSISDRDSPQHALISWSVLVNGVDISNSPYLTLNKLNDNSFTLLTGLQLDRERTPSISVNIVASNPTSSSNQPIVATYFNFTLILVDENDNSPQFDRDLYELNIPENNYLGQIIHKFTATDADVDENGRVVYSLESDGIAPKIVNIDVETGVLRALELFDREKTSLYEFIVVARDRPNELLTNSSRTSRARVRLNIIDQNDNKPVLVYNGTKETLNSSYILIKLDENIPVETEIGRFECHDKDENSNGRTRMVLMNSYDVTLSRATGIQTLKSNNDGPIVIDDSGRFLVNKRLDRESQESFEYVLMCHDPTHNTSVNIHVRLNDVNDNCPRSLNRTNTGAAVKTVFLNRDSDVLDSVPIFTEYYTDDDSGHNAKLSFLLESHAVEFEANASESTDHVYGLKLSLRPNERERLQLGRYVVKLKISDHGNPSCIKTDTFLVYVGDNTTRTQTELIERLRAGITGYINDEYIDITDESNDNKDVVTSLSKSETHKTNSLISHSRLSSALSSLRNTDYFILITLLSTLIITGSILSLVGLIFFCRRDGDKKNKKPKQISRGLEVKNYHRGELSVLNEDTESNNLLSSGGASDEVTATTNRLSLSLKSTDQSQSADSVASNITFTRDTSSSNSSQADEHHHHHHNQGDLIMHKQYGPRVTFGNARNDYQYKHISTTMNRKSADLGQQTPSSYMSSFAPPSSSSSGSTTQQRALKSGANTATTNGIVYSHNTFTSNSLKHHHRPAAPSHHHNHHHHQHLSSQSTYSTSLMMTPTSTSDGSSDTTNCDIIILPTSSSSSHSSSSSSSTSPQPPPPPQTTVANSSLNRQQYNHYRHYVEINDDIDQVDDDDGDVDSSCLVVKQYDQQPVNNTNRTSRYSNSYLRSSAV